MALGRMPMAWASLRAAGWPPGLGLAHKLEPCAASEATGAMMSVQELPGQACQWGRRYI